MNSGYLMQSVCQEGQMLQKRKSTMQRVAYNSSGGSRSLSFRAAFGAGKLSSWRVKCSRSISIWSTYGAVQTYPCSSSVQFPTKNTGVRNIAAIHYKLISPRLYNFKCAFCLFLLLLVPILSQKQWGHRAALPMQWKVWLLIKKRLQQHCSGRCGKTACFLLDKHKHYHSHFFHSFHNCLSGVEVEGQVSLSFSRLPCMSR